MIEMQTTALGFALAVIWMIVKFCIEYGEAHNLLRQEEKHSIFDIFYKKRNKRK